MKLIIGLGNPGDSYKNTRHNLGFAVVDQFLNQAKDLGLSWKQEKKFKAEICQFNYVLGPKSYQLLLVKPQTFMNDSGIAVSAVAEYFKIPVEDIIVIHDDVDIVLGKIKVRMGGSGAGHHGVESVIKDLDSPDFIRVRLGIGGAKRLNEERSMEKFVLETFLPNERSKVKHMIKTAVEAVELLLEKGLETAQNQYN